MAFIQRELDFAEARARGERASKACTDKAERDTNFSVEAAHELILAHLRTAGPQSGEVLVNVCKEAGQVPHDDRAYGAVFSVLARRQLIRCVGFAMRAKGRGAPGARIWEAV
jgi:hypothetical protein